MTRRAFLLAPALLASVPEREVTIKRETDGSWLVYEVRVGMWDGTRYQDFSLALNELRNRLLRDSI